MGGEMSYYYTHFQKLTDEQCYDSDIVYLLKARIPRAVIKRNHKNGYLYSEQAKIHRQIKEDSLK